MPLLSMSAQHGVRPRTQDLGRAASEDRSNYLRVRPGDLVVNKLSARDGGYGLSALEGLVSPAYWVLRPTLGVDPRFLNYQLHSASRRAEIDRRSKFMPPAQFDIAWEDFAALEIPLPPVEEQRRIADFLDDQVARIDALVRLRRTQLDRGDELLESTMQNTIKSPRKLSLRRVVYTWIDYRGATPSKTEFGRQLVTASNVTNGSITFDRVAEFISEEDYWIWMRRGFPARGDVLFTTEAPLGQVAILERTDVALAQRVILLRPDPNYVTSQWLYWSLRSPAVQAEIRSQATGSTAAGIKAARLRGIEIPVPDAVQQQQLSSALRELAEATTERAEMLESSIDLLEERKRALITAAVTGELDVTTAKPIGMGKWVPNVGAGVETPAAAEASSIGGIG